MASRLSALSIAGQSPTPPPNSVYSSPSSRFSLPITNQSSGVSTPSALNASKRVSQAGNILERPYNKSLRSEISLSAISFLISEIISYCQSRVDSIAELESRLSSLGHHVGTRILSLLLLRNLFSNTSSLKDPKREARLIPTLQFIHSQVYKAAFGKPADGLEKSFGGDDEYQISMNVPPLTQHISIPKDMSTLSCEAFTAGIVEGVLDGLDFPAKVTAHSVPTDGFPQRSVVLIKLDQEVMLREAALAAGR
ncbi:Transport protein particle (TRAPP) complex subunit [Phaffia rhodozyma]|uniref:Trafficking protein particle complex subunit n=1 Tax=Phaffia rhodozyma TaxID=264483 RepID=A0A0F7SM27_PHARH|nr:Transport protein particle (TRAPP) complex subunit [Phaffia rhodozyma]